MPGESRGGAAGSLKVGGLSKAIYEAGLEAGIIVRPLAGRAFGSVAELAAFLEEN